MSNRIVLLTQDFFPMRGGTSEYLGRLCQALKEEIVVISPHLPGDELVDSSLPYPVYRYKRWPLLNSINVIVFTLLISLRVRPSVCLISGFYSSHYGAGFWLLNKLFGIPYGFILYGLDMSGMEPWPVETIRRFLLRQAQMAITISDASRQRVMSLGVSEAKIYILFPCADTERFRPVQAQDLRTVLNLDGKRVILTVGRLVSRKGHKLVLEALASRREQMSDVVYLIVGQGPYEEELRRLVDRLDLRGQVIFSGFVPDEELHRYYNLCDLFVMPSFEVSPGDYEGFGIVYLEVNACGKPVIAAEEGGALDAVKEGVSGLLVPPTVKAVADAIITLLSDSERAKSLGESGMRRVIEEFSVPVFEMRVRRLVKQLCGNASSP